MTRPQAIEAVSADSASDAATSMRDSRMSKPHWDMTHEERMAEVARLREVYRRELTTPLMSEGTISNLQVSKMSPRQHERYQRDCQTRMRIEGQIRDLLLSDQAIAHLYEKQVRAEAHTRIGSIDQRLEQCHRFGPSKKTGKMRPKWQREVDALSAQRMLLVTMHGEPEAS